ncbi:hypothetical protein FACS1894137_17820 [Spirochaetia bacterium]|nr:hypothetical protein FACS1894137_17820 [Spirochaetia bacterium]
MYGFLGSVNLFHARLDKGVLKLDNTESTVDVSFFVRPHDVRISMDNESGKGIEAKIAAHRILGSRVRVNLTTLAGDKNIEADIDKKQWNLIKQENRETVYIIFSGAKIYSKDEVWSDYAI